MKNYLYPPLVVCLLAFCSTQKLAGTTDETQTGTTIAGIITRGDGSNAPAADAEVRLYDSSTAMRPIAGLAKREVYKHSDSTHTDAQGRFSIDSVDTGRYFIYVNDHGTMGLLLPKRVGLTDTVRVNDTVKPMGSIQGNLDTALVSKNQPTYVYIAELQLKVTVDSAGAFIATGLPPFDYTLRILHDSTVVSSSLDTGRVAILEGNTTTVGIAAPTHNGEVRLTGGTLAGQAIDSAAWQITVSAGTQITGSIQIQTNNNMIPTAVAPFGYTWTWGERDSSIIQVNSSIPTGLQTWTVQFDQTAPSAPGTYYILFGFQGEYNLNEVFSCTNWQVSSVVWNDGNDYFDMNVDVLSAAHTTGYASFWRILFPDGFHIFDSPVAPIKVVVQ